MRLTPDRIKELSLAGILVVAILVFSLIVDGYLSGRFFTRLSTGLAITVVLACAQTLVILTRNVDLSLGSIVGVTAYVTGELVATNPGLPPVLAFAFGMALGCVLGMVNGALVAYGKVPAIIVTLGTLAIFRTGLLLYAQAGTITADSLPDWVSDLPQATVAAIGNLDLRVVFAGVLVLVVLLQLALSKLRWGRRLYALGSNPDAARQVGLPQRRLVLSAFAASGALGGLAGLLFLARFGTVTTTAGRGLELDSVAAAVVGGVSILGGSGTVVGALLGATLIEVLDQSLVRIPQVSEFWQDALLGALILLAVIADVAINQRFRKLMLARARPRTVVTAEEAGDG